MCHLHLWHHVTIIMACCIRQFALAMPSLIIARCPHLSHIDVMLQRSWQTLGHRSPVTSCLFEIQRREEHSERAQTAVSVATCYYEHVYCTRFIESMNLRFIHMQPYQEHPQNPPLPCTRLTAPISPFATLSAPPVCTRIVSSKSLAPGNKRVAHLFHQPTPPSSPLYPATRPRRRAHHVARCSDCVRAR
jgi:hypothetical protein